MRKIDKTCHLSTTYKTWEENLSIPHPTYNSSKNKYYTDIVTQLLYCQKGLCAFTEQALCQSDCYEENKWVDGRYVHPKPEFEGELDHFDPFRKTQEAWAWDNFLVVSTHINQKIKGRKDIDNILKPDHPDYDANTLLTYNPTTNRFAPNASLSKEDQGRVSNMIHTLGLNFGSIVKKRSMYLNQSFKLMEYESDIDIAQFLTAFRMTNELRENKEETSILDSFID